MSDMTAFEVHPSDRTRIDTEDGVLGWGVRLPSGLCVVDWNRMVFDEDDRLDHPHQSLYGSFDDVEQGTGGDVVKVGFIR
ncbi:hypothetical protein [Haloferax volcanii]|uniref:Uncharacterized protein n=1 Tax=Haloferax volcanii TaxID=2246 RepID=A0A558FUW8_HALVO|nr:hypothetical protein [Haloferax volcanii]TVT89296.1 hypothetical protein FQA18_18570 [Haloferax volcanii]